MPCRLSLPVPCKRSSVCGWGHKRGHEFTETWGRSANASRCRVPFPGPPGGAMIGKRAVAEAHEKLAPGQIECRCALVHARCPDRVDPRAGRVFGVVAHIVFAFCQAARRSGTLCAWVTGMGVTQNPAATAAATKASRAALGETRQSSAASMLSSAMRRVSSFVGHLRCNQCCAFSRVRKL